MLGVKQFLMNRIGRRSSALISGSLLLAACSGPSRSDLLVPNEVSVVDVVQGTVRSNMRVAISGDRIEAVAPTNEYSVPRGAREIDGRGKFVIPGLWDMHVHLQGWWELAFPLFLTHGVLGVRDMGGDPERLLDLRDRVARGELLGPRMLVAGPMLDGPTPDWPMRVTITDPGTARAAVQAQIDRGVDFIKVKERMSREVYLAIAAAADELGIVFAGHVPMGMEAAEAAEAGQRSIEHLTGTSGEETDVFLERGTWHDPTLVVTETFMKLEQPWNWDQYERNEYLPTQVREFWDWAMSLDTQDQSLPPREVRQGWLAGAMGVLGALNEAGVKLLAGTDLSIPTIYPGFAMHDELALMVGAGLTPAEALRSATIEPARYFGRDAEWGSVETGKVADLVVLDANPLADIRDIGKIHAVVLRGQLLERAELKAMLDGALVKRD